MNPEELRITAALAYLDLGEKEYEELMRAVDQMLEYFSKMMEVDIEGLPPTTHTMVRENRTRPDQTIPFSGIEALLENAPEREDRFIVIPNIL